VAGISATVGKVGVTVAAVAALAAATLAIPVVTGNGGGGGETANIWVDPAATTGCTDNASEAAYNAAQDCTWDQANDTCEAGDTVLVRGGSYGDVTISGLGGRSSGQCNVVVAEDASVVFDEFTMGDWRDENPDVVDTGYMSITGGDRAGGKAITARIVYVDYVESLTMDGWEVDGQDTLGRIFSADGATNNYILRDSEVHGSCAEGNDGAMMWLAGDDLTLEDNEIHDALLCDTDTHTECTYMQGVNRVTIRRNRYYRCNVMGIFFTGAASVTGPSLIENNYFGRSCSDTDGTCDQVHVGPYGIHFRNGDDPSPNPDNMVIRNNTFRGTLSIDGSTNAPTSGGLVVKDNIFLLGASCGLANTTYARNAHVSGSCGGTGSFNDSGMLSDFTDPSDFAADGGDWYPLAGAPFINAGSTGDHPTLDLLGVTRYDGSAPDLGAYEFQE
jgi:hypothetical protein